MIIQYNSSISAYRIRIVFANLGHKKKGCFGHWRPLSFPPHSSSHSQRDWLGLAGIPVYCIRIQSTPPYQEVQSVQFIMSPGFCESSLFGKIYVLNNVEHESLQNYVYVLVLRLTAVEEL
jgi:hypothetical protein